VAKEIKRPIVQPPEVRVAIEIVREHSKLVKQGLGKITVAHKGCRRDVHWLEVELDRRLDQLCEKMPEELPTPVVVTPEGVDLSTGVLVSREDFGQCVAFLGSDAFYSYTDKHVKVHTTERGFILWNLAADQRDSLCKFLDFLDE